MANLFYKQVMTDIIHNFFIAYLRAFSNKTVFTESTPNEMMLSETNKNGWFQWKLIPGIFKVENYKEIETEFQIQLPQSFINWHKEYFFLSCNCSILNLPHSNPNLPLQEIRQNLSWFIPQQIIPEKLYPFGSEGNDTGPLVFDGRIQMINNEFPIRVYDHEFGGTLDGLSEIIFSSFEKLLECLTHYMSELKMRKDYEIIPDFFQIDPTGAGSTGIDYWLSWVSMQKANSEEFGN